MSDEPVIVTPTSDPLPPGTNQPDPLPVSGPIVSSHLLGWKSIWALAAIALTAGGIGFYAVKQKPKTVTPIVVSTVAPVVPPVVAPVMTKMVFDKNTDCDQACIGIGRPGGMYIYKDAACHCLPRQDLK